MKKLIKWTIVIILLLMAWTVFKSFMPVSIPAEKMEDIKTATEKASQGKIQVDWKTIAAVAAVEYDIDTLTDEQIVRIVDLFIVENEGRYSVKSIEEVAAMLDFNIRQKQELAAYEKYLAGVGRFFVKDDTSMQTQFIASIEKAGIENYREFGVLPSVTIAQAILESNWGRSHLSTEYNNLFGIKDHGWSGKTASLHTSEQYDRQITAKFRVYDSIDESIKDHGRFLKENPRYTKHGLFEAETYADQAMALQAAGYSTKENENGERIYGRQLMGIIEQYRLYEIDNDVQSANV
ncbi:glycoside hydrolase family 73 protein [Bacillus testis]|uniref:glycoside hydrolase family 73 protein n=1 Tax=Bacillus testis TaxID=1622072 RepID=UPI00067F1023|nr:glucosaminidase domain-containing protein [Bacillus testis]